MKFITTLVIFCIILLINITNINTNTNSNTSNSNNININRNLIPNQYQYQNQINLITTTNNDELPEILTQMNSYIKNYIVQIDNNILKFSKLKLPSKYENHIKYEYIQNNINKDLIIQELTSFKDSLTNNLTNQLKDLQSNYQKIEYKNMEDDAKKKIIENKERLIREDLISNGINTMIGVNTGKTEVNLLNNSPNNSNNLNTNPNTQNNTNINPNKSNTLLILETKGIQNTLISNMNFLERILSDINTTYSSLKNYEHKVNYFNIPKEIFEDDYATTNILTKLKLKINADETDAFTYASNKKLKEIYFDSNLKSLVQFFKPKINKNTNISDKKKSIVEIISNITNLNKKLHTIKYNVNFGKEKLSELITNTKKLRKVGNDYKDILINQENTTKDLISQKRILDRNIKERTRYANLRRASTIPIIEGLEKKVNERVFGVENGNGDGDGDIIINNDRYGKNSRIKKELSYNRRLLDEIIRQENLVFKNNKLRSN